MIRIVYHSNFLRSAGVLSQSDRIKLARLLTVSQANPFHPLLHTKRLTGHLTGILSFRITRDWRVLFCFLVPDCIKLLRVVHRKDAYQ